MKLRYIFATIIVLLGFGAAYIFYSISHYARLSEGEALVSSAQIVTVANYQELKETATIIGSSPQPGPVVLKLGSTMPFTVQIGDVLIRGEEVVNTFGSPNSYFRVLTLEDERIVIREGAEISLVVYADDAGSLRIEPDVEQMQFILLFGYICSFIIIFLGFFVGVNDWQ